MEIVTSYLPLAACLASLVAVVPIVLFGRWPNLREAATLAAGLAKLGLVLSMLPGVLEGKVYEFTLIEIVAGIPLAFRVDALGMLFALVASPLWILTSIYATGYMRGAKEKNQTRFYVFFALAVSFTLGIAFSANMLTLFVFYEALTLSTYPLVSHKGDADTVRSAQLYLGILLTHTVLAVVIGIGAGLAAAAFRLMISLFQDGAYGFDGYLRKQTAYLNWG